MLTIHHISADDQEDVDYYENDETLVQSQDEYYGNAECESQTGKLTQAIWDYNLGGDFKPQGAVRQEDFKQIFHGSIPQTDEALRAKKQNPDDKNILGIDLTYSVPKSVSIQLHRGKDDRIFDVIMQASLECNQILRDRYLCTRVQKNGVRRSVKTDNAAIVMIPHHTSRDGDMQTHIHAVLMNGTRGPDGILRSLDDFAIKKSQIKSLGNIFENKVAAGLQQLGYELEYTAKGWEIKGYTREDILTYSKRSRAMSKYLEEKGLDATPKNKQKAVLKTRKAKNIELTLEQMREAWSYESDVVPQVPKDGPVERIGTPSAKAELESAIRHLSERSVSFDREQIEQYVFRRPKGFDEQELGQAISKHPSLLTVDGERLTTVEALEREVESIQRWMAGQGKAQPLKAAVNLDGTSLNAGQAEAVLRTLLSTDRHQIWHGFSGTGKTTAFKALKDELEGSGVTIRGFATTVEAAETLGKELGIQAKTVQHQVLVQPERTPNQLWIVDEVGMLGAEDMVKMQRQADLVGARLLAGGDKGQNSSIKAGSPLSSLMDHGATVHKLSEILRQQNDIQKKAVELIENGNGVGAVKLLNEKGYIVEIADANERAKAITQQYLDMSLRQRSQTRLVAGTNAECLRITQALRSGLKDEGQLSKFVKVVKLVSLQFTEEEKRRIENYNQGDYIQLRRAYPGTSLQNGQLYKVEKRVGNELVVSSYGGRMYRIDPSKHKDKDVYYAKSIEIAVGDRVRWTIADKQKGRTNGRHLTVTAINETSLSVQDVKTRKTHEVSLLQPLAVDYDWVSTSYKVQGSTYKETIGSTTNDPTSSREALTVTISRQKHDLTLYTEDLKQLERWANRSNAQENPLELIGKDYGNRNQSRTEARQNHSAASNAPTAKRSAPSAVPELAGPEREPELLGEGAHEHVADGNEGLAQQFHRGVHGGAEQPEVRQDGRIYRQTLKGNGELGNQDRGLQPGESPDEHSSRRVSGPDQGGLQAAAPERGAEATEAPEDWSRDHFTRLAAALGQIQSESQLNEALAERIGRLSEQLELLSSNRLDEPFTGMAQLGQAVSDYSEQAAWLEVTDSLSDLVESLERRSQMAELAKQLGSLAEHEVLNLGGLAEELETLYDHLGQFSRNLPSQFEGMDTLAQSLNESHQIESLSELSEQMEGLTETLNQTSPERSRFEGMGQLAAAVRDSQQMQALQVEDLAFKIDALTEKLERIQTLDGKQFEHMDVLAQTLNDVVEVEALSVLSDQAQRLSAGLGGSVTTARANRFEKMSELAAAVVVSEQQQILESSDLAVRIEALLEQVEGILAEPKPSNQFEGMAALAESLSTQQQQSNLVEVVAQVSSELERVTEGLTYATMRDKAATIGAAIQQWRSEQFIAEQVLQTNPEQAFESLEAILAQVDAFGDVRPEMQTLVKAIEAWQSEQALSQTIEQFSERRSIPVHTWADISQLAQAVCDRQAQESIAEHLETFTTFSEQLQEGLRQRTDLQQLGEVVRTLRSIELVQGPASEQLQQIAQRLRQMEISPTPKPIKQPIFSRPDYTIAECPDKLEPRHWEEFKRSAIHPELIAANTESVSGEAVYERLLSERLAQMGTGQYVTQPMARLMAQYEQVAGGGWWGKAGIDARSLLNLQPGQLPQLSTWGCFKADSPRIDQDKSNRKGETELIKYENPLGVSRSLYLPIMPDSLAERIYSKHDIEPTAAERQSGFWAVVHQYNLPITITEGAKKTWASLSQGEVTIGVSGVNGLYRAKDQEGNLLPGRQLNEEMAVFATPGREFRFAFDQDTKASTVRNVRRDMVRGIELLEAQGCTCKVASWKPADGKGLDDLIVNRGPAAYTSPIALAEPSDKTKRTHYRTEYNLIARQVRINNPEASPEQLNAEVYLRAIAKGELKDGIRFIGQSDQARALKDPEAVAAYIEQVKANAPLYRQQRQALEIAKDQERKDRTVYEGLAQSITAEMGALKPGPLDIEVCIKLTPDNPNLERILAQSDWAKSRETPEDKNQYIQMIQTAASLTLQQRQTAQDRAEYETLAARIRKSPVQLSSEVVDMQVYLTAEREGNPGDGDRLIAQSDHTLSLQSKQAVSAYVEHIKAEAPLYLQRMSEQMDKANYRRLYEELTDAIQQENTGIQPSHSDMEVYLRAEAKGLDGESILAQSDSALSLSNPDQAQAYIDQIIAEAPLYSQQKQERAAVQAQHEQELADSEANIAATASSQNDPTPVQVLDQQSAERPKPIRAITEPQKAQQKVDQAVASIKQELRAQYDDIVQQVKSKLGEVPPEIVDLEVYLKTMNPDQAKRLIHVGDKMTALTDADSDFTDSYSDAIAQVAPAYDEIKNNPNAKLNHRMMVAIVNNTTAQLQLQKVAEPTVHRKKEREDELML